MTHVRVVGLVLVLLTLGCTDLFGPEVRFWNRRPMDPVPDVYADWYAEVEECLGWAGDFEAISFYVADRIERNGVEKTGLVEFPHAITVRVDQVWGPRVLRHEFAHHITQAGTSLHDGSGNVPCQ